VTLGQRAASVRNKLTHSRNLLVRTFLRPVMKADWMLLR